MRVKGTEADPGVKEVTRGVKEVELEDKKEGSSPDDGKGTADETVDTPEDEPSVAPSPDPTHTPQEEDSPSAVPDDEAPIVQSEATAEAPSNDSPDVRTPGSSDVKEPVAPEDEKESADATPDTGDDGPDTGSDEVAHPNTEPDATTPAAKCDTVQEQQ